MVECTLYFLALPLTALPPIFLTRFDQDDVLITGVPHGWVLEPHSDEAQHLLKEQWNFFALVKPSDRSFQDAAELFSVAFEKTSVSIPQTEYDQLVANARNPATPSKETPPLPEEWSDGDTGAIPARHAHPAKAASLEVGELKLYEPMASYLANALPNSVRDKPVSLFNLFKYRNGDPSVHEHYMQGFKEKFGPAAGAQLKFMGPVSSQPKYIDTAKDNADSGYVVKTGWQDANVVQYDSIWHYAYMLSTDIYQELNKEKIEGLEDTCILLISEAELQR